MSTLQTVGLYLGAGAAGLTILAFTGKGVHWMIRTLRKVGRLVDDVLGAPAHGTQPARSSLMDRLGAVEDGQQELCRRVAAVEAAVHPNGGTSMADAVSRIARAVGTEPIPPVQPGTPPPGPPSSST